MDRPQVLLALLLHTAAELTESDDWATTSSTRTLEVRLLELAKLRSLIHKLEQVEAVETRWALQAMPAERYEVAGLYARRVPGCRTYNNWNDTEVAQRVLTRGAHTVDAANSHTVLTAIASAARLTWRTSVLRRLGVDFEDLVDMTDGRTALLIQTPSPQRCFELR